MITHLTRNDSGGYDKKIVYGYSPIDFAIVNIPDGTPFKIYIDAIGEDNDVTEDFEALQEDAEFFIVESPGGGGGIIGKIFDPLGVTKRILKLISPQPSTSSNLSNQQGESPNNSLTDRTNKPRPYQRTYDICGTIQSIPCDLMTVWKAYNAAGNIVEYGYYEVARGPVDHPANQITDGDTLMSEITGSSAAVFEPYTSPNNSVPSLLIGDPITENLYITVSSNEIDGATLKAANELATNVGDVATATLSGTIGTITDPTGDSEFNAYVKAGDIAKLTDIQVDLPGDNTDAYLSGYYPVLTVSGVNITFDVSGNLAPWQSLGASNAIKPQDTATVGPQDTYTASLTDWVTIDRIKAERLVANIGADNGMYKDNGNRKQSASVTAELQYQLLDADGVPYGSILTAQGTVTGRSADETGVTIYANLPTPSAVRVRARRVTDKDFDYDGQVIDEIKYNNLYAQIRDTTPHYGNRTTIYTVRKQTARATSIKSPQLKMVVTERLYKYLGNGVFDTVLSNNTQAMQSLIRLLRDPIVGGLNLTTDNMDKLLATQVEIEQYFGKAEAGQFCYTFDSYDATMQDIISTIADAVFCSATRIGQSVLLELERPRMGPEMVFTHRSKAPDGEKWTRNFNDRNAFDSLKFGYIDPDTNIKETITIPADGGLKTETYDSKGIRNYQQAYLAAMRRFQKNSLNRVAVEFTAMEEGILAVPNRPISVVKGSRVSPFDGYVIAVDGLTLTLSQNVEFTSGDDHSIILKRRDGSVQSVTVTPGAMDRQVVMTSAPQEAIYTGNSALKTEFSFGNEQRHNAQMMIVSTVEPNDNREVKITAYNYDPDYYKYDGGQPVGRAFSNGFSNGFS